MKTDNISFGTSPSIGSNMATAGLPKYKMALTEGIYDAFDKLSKNGIDDNVNIHLGVNSKAKSKYTNVIEFCYRPKDKQFDQSSKAFSPKSLEKLSKNQISELFITTYKKLTKSKKMAKLAKGIPYEKPGTNISVTKEHKDLIIKLDDKFGWNDSNFFVS